MSQLRTQMRHRDREMVPRILVQGMFVVMLSALALVTYAQLAGVPNVGAVKNTSEVARAELYFSGDRHGTYTVYDADGQLVAVSSEPRLGFVGVIGRVVSRNRELHGADLAAPISIVRRDNGQHALLDPSTGWSMELIGYGADNIAAFAQMID